MSADKAARLAAIRAANARKAAPTTIQRETSQHTEGGSAAVATMPGATLRGLPASAPSWRIPHARQIIATLLFAAVTGLLLSAVLNIWQPIVAYALPYLSAGLGELWQALATYALPAVPPSYLTISRATALMSYGLLWLSMALGLAITSRATRLWPGGPVILELHQHLSLLGLLFAVAHVASLLAEPALGYSLAKALLPWAGASYRPFWVGLVGKTALYLMAIVWLSFYVRKWIGGRWWRRIHYLSFAMFLLALIHGVFAGSDTSTIWARAVYAISGVLLLALLAYRIVRTRRVQASEIGTLQIEALTLDPIARVVKLGAHRRATLRATEARLLYYLMQNAGRVVSAEQLLENVWGRHYRGKLRLVASAMQRLRAKIEPNAASPNYIYTLRNQAYHFGALPPLVTPPLGDERP